jgi:hypothetical protein
MDKLPALGESWERRMGLKSEAAYAGLQSGRGHGYRMLNWLMDCLR